MAVMRLNVAHTANNSQEQLRFIEGAFVELHGTRRSECFEIIQESGAGALFRSILHRDEEGGPIGSPLSAKSATRSS
jgi:hypothetical protein